MILKRFRESMCARVIHLDCWGNLWNFVFQRKNTSRIFVCELNVQTKLFLVIGPYPRPHHSLVGFWINYRFFSDRCLHSTRVNMFGAYICWPKLKETSCYASIHLRWTVFHHDMIVVFSSRIHAYSDSSSIEMWRIGNNRQKEFVFSNDFFLSSSSLAAGTLYLARLTLRTQTNEEEWRGMLVMCFWPHSKSLDCSFSSVLFLFTANEIINFLCFDSYLNYSSLRWPSWINLETYV